MDNNFISPNPSSTLGAKEEAWKIVTIQNIVNGNPADFSNSVHRPISLIVSTARLIWSQAPV